MSTTTTLAAPDTHTTIAGLEVWLAARKAQVQKGAELLISFAKTAETDLATIQENDPLAAAAISLAVKKGAELGLPEAQINTLGHDVIAAAQAIAGTPQPAQIAAEPAGSNPGAVEPDPV